MATARPSSAARRTNGSRRHRQGRAEHEQHLRLIIQRPGGVAHGWGHVLAEEHHVRLQHPVAREAGGDAKAPSELRVELDVAVGEERRRRRPAGVEREQAGLQCSRLEDAAVEAAHLLQRAVELDDATAPSAVVEAIDVLGDDAAEEPGGLERGDGVVPALGRAAEKRVQPATLRAQ